jgi:hypothetical protein
MRPTRRRVVAATALFGLAGCIDRSTSGEPSTPSPTPEPPADVRLEDGVPAVAFPAIADGEVTVRERLLVAYTAPVEASFDPAAIHDGTEIEDEPTSDVLRVNPTVPEGGPPTVYLAPVYREGEGFEYRLYANEAFVSLHEWQLSAGTGNAFDEEGSGSRAASFERHYRHVHRDVVTADLVPDAAASDPLSVGVFQYDAGTIRAGPPGDVTGVLLSGRRGPRRTPTRAPQIAFAFEREGGTVTVVHEGGDTADASNLLVRLDGTPADTQWADEHEEVSAGDRIAVDVGGAPEGATLRVVWESDDGDHSAVLAQYRVP